MDNLIYTLLAALVVTINANAGVIAKSATASLGRIRPLTESELPHIGVFYTGDIPLGDLGASNLTFIDWDVNVAIEIALDADATTTAEDFQKEMLNLRADVHEALQTVAPTQGLSFVINTIVRGADEPLTDDVGKRKTLSYRSNWQFHIRTTKDDMTT